MTQSLTEAALPSSFRDPSGFLFQRGGRLYRSVAPSYAAHYDRLMASGLYAALTQDHQLVAHREVELEGHAAHRVLEPERLPFVSYPYEWCAAQLRDAGLLSLDLATRALAHDMVLKDASAFNVQFRGSRAIFIDTLSFEAYRAGEPWVAYRQFCRHFLAPLAVMAYRDVRLAALWRGGLEGLPLDLASRLLPLRTWLKPGLALHLHMQARSESMLAQSARSAARPPVVSRQGMLALLDSLRRTLSKLRSRGSVSAWEDYEKRNSYGPKTRDHKESFVRRALEQYSPGVVFDLGANVGRFGRLAAEAGGYAVCMDADPTVTEQSYLRLSAAKSSNVLPLVMDLTNPSPSLGWSHSERSSLAERGPADLALALALVHHLAIGANVPLPRVAAWLAGLARRVVVEWVPKTDIQVVSMLSGRRDIFDAYSAEAFEAAFAKHWRLATREPLAGSERVMYVWERLS